MSGLAIALLGFIASIGLIAGTYYVIGKLNGTHDKKPNARHDKYDEF